VPGGRGGSVWWTNKMNSVVGDKKKTPITKTREIFSNYFRRKTSSIFHDYDVYAYSGRRVRCECLFWDSNSTNVSWKPSRIEKWQLKSYILVPTIIYYGGRKLFLYGIGSATPKYSFLYRIESATLGPSLWNRIKNIPFWAFPYFGFISTPKIDLNVVAVLDSELWFRFSFYIRGFNSL